MRLSYFYYGMKILFKFYVGIPIASGYSVIISHGETRRNYPLANGLYTAAAGASAQAQNLEVIANNLANTDSAAFKKDLPTFKEYLATVEAPSDTTDIPRGAIKDKDLHPLDGRDQSYVMTDGTYTSFKQGHLRVTQGQFDVALDGPGFLEVNTPNGLRYTRMGSMKVAADGRLVTSEGYPVLSQRPLGLAGDSPQDSGVGADPVARYLNLKDKGVRFSINQEGEIYAGEDLLGKLSVVEFQDTKKLRKVGGQLFDNKDTANRLPAKQTLVRQGVIETSNVNPVEEMTNMIKANRLFEHDLKALKTFGEMLGKEANEVGKL